MSAIRSKVIYALAMGLTLASCKEVVDDTDLTSVDIQLPDRAKLKDKVADIEQKMNGYHLVILSEPNDPQRCTQLSRIGDYAANAKVEAKLKQGCDYKIRLAIGQKPSEGTGDTSAKVTYADVRPILQAKCVRCHPGSSIPLDTYGLAKDKIDATIDRIGREANAPGVMPPGGQLTAQEKELFTKWKADGLLEKAEASGGKGGSGAEKLTKVYYMNDEYKVITKAELQGKTRVQANITLKLQNDGREIGLDQ